MDFLYSTNSRADLEAWQALCRADLEAWQAQRQVLERADWHDGGQALVVATLQVQELERA
jgi:hypothetical protein